MAMSSSYIRWFETIRLEDVPFVGGKNASLGELYRELGTAGVKVPNGFALTVAAYADALSSAKAWAGLHALLDNLDIADVTELAERAEKARQIVYDATGNEELRADIEAAYRRLETQYGTGVAVAVRSSATAEDLPTASFAGQHESYLNIRGIDDLFEACRRCFASLFTDRAIVYRVNNGFDHFKVGLSVGVMKMVRSDRASSGVIFTLDTEFGFPDVVFITGVYGLGENIVQGKWIRTSFTCTSRPSSKVIAPCCAARSGESSCASPMRKAIPDRPHAMFLLPRMNGPASASRIAKY